MTPDVPAPLPAVAREWGRRTVAEYTSAALTQQITLWLLLVGGPPDLVRAGLRVVEDELAHSELAADVSDAAGASGERPALDPAGLAIGDGDPAASLVSWTVRSLCVGETVAVPLFRLLRSRCTVPVARVALDRVLRDEPHHRQLGWDLLDWLLLVGGGQVAQSVTEEVPALLDQACLQYETGVDEDPEAPGWDDAAAWGVVPMAAYRPVVLRAIVHEVIPRLAVRDIAVGWPGPLP